MRVASPVGMPSLSSCSTKGSIIQPLSKSQKESLERATTLFQEQLLQAPDVIGYLKARGFGRDTAEGFRLGAVVDPPEGFERFAGCLAIPNHSGAEDSHITGIKFRRLEADAKPKYDQPHGQTQRLFNLRAIRQAQRTGVIYITEGEIDCMTVSLLGHAAVGVPGADSFAPKGVRYRYRIFDGLKVVVIKDNDDSGEKLAQLLIKELPDVTVLSPSPCNDVNELWNQLGHDEMEMDLWLTDI